MQSTRINTNENHTLLGSRPEQAPGAATTATTGMLTNGMAEPDRGEPSRPGLFDQLDRENLRLHVTILGWLYVIGNAVLLLVGGFVFTFLSGIGAIAEDPQAFAVLSIVGTTVGILLGSLALPGMIAGFGLLRGKEWGRILGGVVAILSLINFPLGTLIGLYALWVLLQKESTVYFGKAIAR